ncbi:S1 family peptidase [Azospirillum soli]|uniref:S1 family peptidase n=1 Tax=Azospirillum soli TaxID=1304799 RepID=UPI001AE8D6E0|nr:serine protease [Azospirillum soli]MBP2313130.1 hypothetical protein [Azospirillum soli]
MRKLARSAAVAFAVLLTGATIPRPLPAVVILDSTWREEGGARGREADGFSAHIRLANQPQFRSLVALAYEEDGEWGAGSGTWLGNDDAHGHAYVLTSAHNFDEAEAGEVLVRTDGGTVLRGDRVWIHPGYDTEGDHTGVDVAILRLNGPITDAGPPPLLYAGNAEKGQTITFMGFGTRGIASVGEDERYHRGTDKAAAQGVVDEAVPLRRGSVRMDDPGNFLSVFLPREDGGVENPISGARRPVSRLAGLLGSGDSGGSAWMQRGDRWVVVGVNTSGDGKAQYGDSSWFVRVSGVRPWIASIVPGARFSGDDNSPAVPLPVPAIVAALSPSSATSAGCSARQRFFAFSDGAWYPASALGPGRRSGSCLVHYDDYADDQDEEVGPKHLIPWTPGGPGTALSGCEPQAEVLAEEDGVWYPATVVGGGRRGCRVGFEDSDDETLPLDRLRTLR